MRRVLTAGAVGLGLGGMGAAISGNDAERDAGGTGQRGQHQPDLALVFADDYRSNALFRPIDRLPQRAVNTILGYSVNEDDPAVSEPADYNGYVVLVKQTPSAQGEYTFVFVNEETLQEDRWYRLTDDVVFFDARIRLLSVALATGDGGHETATEETTTREETTATNAKTTTRTSETTTHEVVVKATETNDGE